MLEKSPHRFQSHPSKLQRISLANACAIAVNSAWSILAGGGQEFARDFELKAQGLGMTSSARNVGSPVASAPASAHHATVGIVLIERKTTKT